jgi:1-deoxy-D-xylulose-5-phosphate synthase
MGQLLSGLRLPHDLRLLSVEQLKQLAQEIRDELVGVLRYRSAHFASNLGVVELCLALHRVYDFASDRIVWDTGHQIYPHKLITGRHEQIHSIRTRGGLMGFPNPNESPYDLFMTGHAGCSISCGLGLAAADSMRDGGRRTVAVIGDGAFPSGIVYEALNHAGELRKDLTVVLNDNQMSICPRTGALGQTLDRARIPDFPPGLRHEERGAEPGDASGFECGAEMAIWPHRLLSPCYFFETLGWRYIGPIDGHDLPMLVKCFEDLKHARGPILLHVLTEKGHGFQPAVEDSVKFHAPAPFEWDGQRIVTLAKPSQPAYTDVASSALHEAMLRNPQVVVITAAMCEGNKLQRTRAQMPERFFDTGICESHAVAFAAGMAKSGLRPVVAIYSTFLQRAYDQLFQEIALQNLPVTFCIDRAGVVGPDGPTHHGMFDSVYLRSLPNLTIMAPGDALDLPAMLDFAVQHPGPACLRYPKTAAEQLPRDHAPVELGKAEVLRWGADGTLIAYGTLLPACVRAADILRSDGLDVGVINARFLKPLDRKTLLRAVEESPFVLTVVVGTLQGGFGSALLEAANDAGLEVRHCSRLGLPDRFIEHGERDELLAALGLDVEGICQAALRLAERCAGKQPSQPAYLNAV